MSETVPRTYNRKSLDRRLDVESTTNTTSAFLRQSTGRTVVGRAVVSVVDDRLVDVCRTVKVLMALEVNRTVVPEREKDKTESVNQRLSISF